MTESTSSDGPVLKGGERHLCILAEQNDRCFDLMKDGESFVIRTRDDASERSFESLPALLAGLQSFFLEFRVAGAPAKGFAELAAAQERAKSDVIEASRRIYAAMDSDR